MVAIAACNTRPQNQIVIGSKNFTEQLILGELLAQHIEANTNLKV
ncbi:MAG TPA: ABC transporter substrate-binding protein, partial [Cyanobacteria bacterium UBA11368]|nr:ABC transporter substrate-binding protein [Cyanobacteria bacterium UBA11368]